MMTLVVVYLLVAVVVSAKCEIRNFSLSGKTSDRVIGMICISVVAAIWPLSTLIYWFASPSPSGKK